MSAPNPPSTHANSGARSSEDLLLDLLDRWEEERRAGRDPTAEELCPDSTAIQAELRERIRRRRRLDALLASSEQTITSTTLPEVGGYEVLEELGRGGMGVVYRARHLSLNRVVALKMLLGGGLADTDSRGRFRTEAEAVARLQHPNIVQIHDVGFHEGQPYLALEFVSGGSLGERLAGNPQPPRDAAAMLGTLARAVQHAHERGVVHRDLKPGNVLCEPLAGTEFQLKITDFGLAKQLDAVEGQTRTGAVMGTPAYMAPEQAAGRGQEIGPATDVWALGVLLYEMLTGRPPFKSASLTETLDLVRTQEPVPVRRLQPKTPRDLETICLKCLRKEPGKRYSTAGALADDLYRFLEGRPITARPVSAWERAVKWIGRNPSAAALIAVSVAAVVGLGGVGLFYNARLTQQRDEARDQRTRAERALTLALQTSAVLDNLGMTLYERNREDEKEETFRIAASAMSQNLVLLEAMVQEAPDNPVVRSSLARSYEHRGDLYAARNKVDESETDLRRSLREWDAVIAQHPETPGLVLGQALTRAVLSRMQYYVRGNRDEAFALCSQVIPVLEQAVREPKTPVLARYKLTEAYVMRAEIQLLRNQFAESLADWDRALADPTLGPGTLRFKYEFGRTYVAARAGRWQEAIRAADRLRRDPHFPLDYFRDLAEIHALCARAMQDDVSLSSEQRSQSADKQVERALGYLNEGIDAGQIKGAEAAEYLASNADLTSLKGRPEFEALLKKLRQP